MTNASRWKERIQTELSSVRDTIGDTVAWLADHPEPGGKERQTATFISNSLAQLGFDVEEGVGDLPTAFVASSASVNPGPDLGLVSVYDAVPAVNESGQSQPNHSCGHLIVAAGVIATAMIWRSIRNESRGTLTVIGCPADEHATDLSRIAGGGKAALERAGVFEGLDAVLYAHPEDRNTVWRQTQWMARLKGTLVGERSVDSGLPSLLARVVEAGVAISRSENGTRVLLERLTTSGDSAGGARIAVHIDLIVRADNEVQLELAIHQAMEYATDIAWQESARYRGIRPHQGLIGSIENVFEELGMEVDPSPPMVRYATDFGVVSASRPSALIALGNRDWAFHSDMGSDQFLQAAVPETLRFARIISVVVPVLMESVDAWPSH